MENLDLCVPLIQHQACRLHHSLVTTGSMANAQTTIFCAFSADTVLLRPVPSMIGSFLRTSSIFSARVTRDVRHGVVGNHRIKSRALKEQAPGFISVRGRGHVVAGALQHTAFHLEEHFPEDACLC